MKTTLLIAASALTLAGCQGASPPAAKLDCPTTEGDLTRVSITNDGKACAYRSADGAEVSLELIPVVGDAQSTLAKIEAALRSTPGAPSADTAERQADTSAKIADVAATTANLNAIAAEATRVQAEAAADAGLDVGSRQDSDRKADDASVNLPGIHVSGDDETAKVRIGPLSVDADGDDTTVNIYREVRMRGEALSREKRGLRATFIYTGQDLPAGYGYIGYEAGGPKTGPLTVARIRSKAGTKSGDNINQDVRELVRRNGGV